MVRIGFRKLYFLSYFLTTYLTHDFNNNKDSVHGNESAITHLESESVCVLCTKESARSQLYNVSPLCWKSMLIAEACSIF